MGQVSTVQTTDHRRYRFGLRSLVLFVVAVATFCGVMRAWSRASSRAEAIRRSVAGPIEDLGAEVQLDWSGDLPTVRGIGFYNGKVCHDDDLALFKEHRHIQSLMLGWCPVTNAGLSHLAELGELTYLGLTATNVTDGGMVHLEHLTNLRFLRLGFTKISDAGLQSLSGLKQLESLELWDTRVTDQGVRWLVELPSLKTLELAGTQVSDAGIEQLAALTKLEYVSLGHTRVTDAGIGRLSELRPDLRVSNAK